MRCYHCCNRIAKYKIHDLIIHECVSSKNCSTKFVFDEKTGNLHDANVTLIRNKKIYNFLYIEGIVFYKDGFNFIKMSDDVIWTKQNYTQHVISLLNKFIKLKAFL